MHKPKVAASPRRWNPLSQGWVKVNINAAVFTDLGCVGVASVIRDEQGNLLVQGIIE